MSYTGTVSQIFALGGFRLWVIVWNGETRPEIIAKLEGGVLGLAWVPASDFITMHTGVNMSLKKTMYGWDLRSTPTLCRSWSTWSG